jgi:hypothetical protein
MPEALKNFESKHVRQESATYDFSLEAHKGRRRRAGKGIMSLISRMHRMGMHGRHVNAGNQPHPAVMSAERAAIEPVTQNRALSATVEAAPASQIPRERTEVQFTPGRAAVEFTPTLEQTKEWPQIEASNIRPEIPAAAVEAAHAEVPYMGKHRRPENLEESDAALARAAAYDAALPGEAHREPASAPEVAPADQTPVEGGWDVEPASHQNPNILGSSWWNLPGLRVDQPESRPLHAPINPSLLHRAQHGSKQEANGWFDSANKHR